MFKIEFCFLFYFLCLIRQTRKSIVYCVPLFLLLVHGMLGFVEGHLGFEVCQGCWSFIDVWLYSVGDPGLAPKVIQVFVPGLH